MKNLKISYSAYELKFKKPFVTSKSEISKKKGFLIKISDSSFSGMGECAPFPEFGSETIERADEKLKDLNIKLNLNPNNFKENLQNSFKKLENFPSLKHGIEQALLNLICNKTNISLNELLNVSSNSEILVNAVVGFLPPAESVKVCSDLLKEGFKTIKIKVGRDKFEDDIKVIKKIRDKLGNDFKIRIDANGKWNLKNAILILNSLEKYNIEYVEQPVNSIQGFIKLKKETKIPLAADESIRTLADAEKFIDKKAADVLIIKPMMLGGLLPTLKIIELCEKNKMDVVITSSFESSLGRSFAIFAASIVKNKNAHGLGTAKYFIKDIYPDPYPIKNGKIILK
ncbi:MAG: o-succinylbenzoate synthase [Bacteroidetes bacterium]|nr:o-succinylbenzoate synthase [Bacteroidota bacterium]